MKVCKWCRREIVRATASLFGRYHWVHVETGGFYACLLDDEKFAEPADERWADVYAYWLYDIDYDVYLRNINVDYKGQRVGYSFRVSGDDIRQFPAIRYFDIQFEIDEIDAMLDRIDNGEVIPIS